MDSRHSERRADPVGTARIVRRPGERFVQGAQRPRIGRLLHQQVLGSMPVEGQCQPLDAVVRRHRAGRGGEPVAIDLGLEGTPDERLLGGVLDAGDRSNERRLCEVAGE